MRGVTRGERVRWSPAAVIPPGTSRFTAAQLHAAAAAGPELRGVVLDRHPDAGTWWVLPEGARAAVPVKARDMQPQGFVQR